MLLAPSTDQKAQKAIENDRFLTGLTLVSMIVTLLCLIATNTVDNVALKDTAQLLLAIFFWLTVLSFVVSFLTGGRLSRAIRGGKVLRIDKATREAHEAIIMAAVKRPNPVAKADMLFRFAQMRAAAVDAAIAKVTEEAKVAHVAEYGRRPTKTA